MSEVGKINSLKNANVRQEPEKVTEEKFREVADLYEKYFIREMMKQMRSTVHEGGFIKQNNAEKIFRDQLDDQYAEQWGKAGGIGLSNIIHEQIMNKYGTQFGLRAPLEKPQGPLAFNDKSSYAGPVKSRSSAEVASPKSLVLQLQNQSEERAEITSPWAGILLEKNYMDVEQMRYRIKHDNGLESSILARGTGLGDGHKLSLGDTVQSGQALGWAQPASPLFWSLRPTVSE